MATKKKTTQKSTKKKQTTSAPPKKSTAKKQVKKTTSKATTKKSTIKKSAPKKTVKKAAPKKTQPQKRPEEHHVVTPEKPAPPSPMMAQEKEKSGSKYLFIVIIILLLAGVFYVLKPGFFKTTEVNKDDSPAPPVADEPLEAQKTPEEDAGIYYEVKYKDQLTEISKKFYGRHDRWKEIYEANKDTIDDPTLIFPGQRLMIPGIE